MEGYNEFIEKMHVKIQLDLSKYKENQLKRRIIQFMERYKYNDFRSFLHFLEHDADALAKFRDYVTINTSEFFRDVKVFNYINDHIISEWSRERKPARVWSAGCSVGAEAYSISILCLQKNLKNVSILATDYDRSILAKAKAGEFSPTYLKNVTSEIRARYFENSQNSYLIKNEAKNSVTFKEHNLLADQFPKEYDLILCRNVFIYFNNDVQQDLIKRFAQATKAGGYFVIGSSEFIAAPERFGLEKQSYSVYRKVI
jgi:chemotaxis protein methyltransferase CheR